MNSRRRTGDGAAVMSWRGVKVVNCRRKAWTRGGNDTSTHVYVDLMQGDPIIEPPFIIREPEEII